MACEGRKHKKAGHGNAATNAGIRVTQIRQLDSKKNKEEGANLRPFASPGEEPEMNTRGGNKNGNVHPKREKRHKPIH